MLSGGERNRYALARMLMTPKNFLLLDEPTNHLDIRAKDVLLNALREFNGTVVFVSHDRYFLDNLATRVIEVADGVVTPYPDNYEDYIWRKNGGATTAAAAPATAHQPEHHEPKPHPPRDNKPQPPAQPEQPKQQGTGRLNLIKLRQMKERQRSIEDEVTRLEVEIADFQQALSHFQSADDIEIAGILESRRNDMT